MNPFIVIEALDAGGSQTQTDRLAGRLRQEKYTPHQYHFPQEDAATGQMVYGKYLHAMNKGKFSKREQALLYIQDFYSRADEMNAHLAQENGKHVVVSDRFYPSTMAYQTINMSGQARHRLLAWIQWLCEEGTPHLPAPSLVILLDTPVEITLRHLRAKQKDFHEDKHTLTAVRRSYLRLARERKWSVISGADKSGRQRSIGNIHTDVWNLVRKKL